MTINEKCEEIKNNEEALNVLYEIGNDAMKARAHGIDAPAFEEVVEMVYRKYFV